MSGHTSGFLLASVMRFFQILSHHQRAMKIASVHVAVVVQFELWYNLFLNWYRIY